MDQEEANKFINSLVKNLQVLCHGHVNFRNSIQVIGHLYLNVDSSVNIDYIVNEKVCKNDMSSTVFVSNSYHSEPQKKPPARPQDSQRNQKKNTPIEHEHLEARVDLTEADDGIVVQRLLPINFGSSSNTPSAIHPAYRDQGPSHQHHSRKSKRPFHNIEASSAKMPRISLAPSSRTVNKNDSIVKQETDNLGLNSSQLQLPVVNPGVENDFSNVPQPQASESSITDNNTASPSQNNENADSSLFETSLHNIKNEPGEDLDQNSSLYEQQLGSNSSQTGQHSDASADEEFFSGLRDKTLGVFPVALHASDQVMGSDNYSSLSQPSTSSFKTEMGDLDPGSSGRNLDSTLNVSQYDLQMTRQMKNVSCTFCDAVYSNKNSLYSHINDKHKEWKFICSICHKAFNRKYHLQRHMVCHQTAIFDPLLPKFDITE